MSEAQSSAPGDAGQGGAQTTDAATTTDAGGAATTTEAPKPWYATTLTKSENQGYAETKGWTDPDAAIESYRNLEKLRGVPADRLLTIPESLDDAEAMKPIIARLGLAPPEKADDYGLITMEGVDPDFAKVAQDWMFEANLTPKQAKMMAEKQVAYMAARAAEEETARVQANEAEFVLWRTENGPRHDAVLESARRAGRLAGFTAEQIATLESQVGAAGVMKAFARIGDMLGESTFIRAEDKPGFSLSPAGAQSQIATLRSDKDFVAKLQSGDAQAKEKWTRLHQLAYPEGQQ